MTEAENVHIAPAVEEEHRLLQEHMQQQQTRYLMNRCVALNVAAREAAVEQVRGDDDFTDPDFLDLDEHAGTVADPDPCPPMGETRVQHV